MKYIAKNTALSVATDCLLIGIYEDQQLSATAAMLDSLTNGYIQRLVQQQEISGKVGQTLMLRHLPNLAAERVLLLGCGKKGELTVAQYKQIIQKAVNSLKETCSKSAVSFLHEIEIKDRSAYWNTRIAVETCSETLYRFEQFKSQKAPALSLESFIFHCDDADLVQAEQAVQHASAVAFGVSLAKDVANCPPNICNPSYLSRLAKELEQQYALIKTQVLNEAEMAKLGMNAYLAVSRGSANEAQMSIIEYRNHPNKSAKPIVLVGKGLTFDAGGISLKPADSMDEMKYDMCGAATVYGVMNAIAKLQLPLNVIGVLAGCENLPDGNAYRPGDILTTMSGLTVEVLNTDAEGRLVLCDALTYVERFEPELVIDVATLTGACVVALGQHNSGLIATDDVLAEKLLQAAVQSADKAWRLPLGEEYQEQLKSNFADLANIGGRWGGAITAGAFLSNFTKNYSWAHLDIAGTAWLQGANKGATGRPVGLLMQFLLNQCQ